MLRNGRICKYIFHVSSTQFCSHWVNFFFIKWKKPLSSKSKTCKPITYSLKSIILKICFTTWHNLTEVHNFYLISPYASTSPYKVMAVKRHLTISQDGYHGYNIVASKTKTKLCASQMTSLAIVYSTVHSGADQRKHQSSASLALVRWIHWWLVNSLHKWPVTWKMFPFDDVIM